MRLELETLHRAWDRTIVPSGELDGLTQELRRTKKGTFKNEKGDIYPFYAI